MTFAVDPLSQLLSLGGFTAAVSTGLQAKGVWSIRVPCIEGLKCNIIRRGTCLLHADGRIWTLAQGDCFIVAPGLQFVIASDLKVPPREASDVFSNCGENSLAVLDAGDGPEFLCMGGRMELLPTATLLMSSFPPVAVVSANTPGADRISWLLDRLEIEQSERGQGSSAMVASIMKLVFIELIRSLPDREGRGWLTALRDPRVGPAIQAIHDDPRHGWRLDELARICNLSRSQFSVRFRSAVGMAPIDYLLRWRMELARKALSQPGMTISNVASDFGYASESAFGVAFRRVIGLTPRRAAKDDRERAVPARFGAMLPSFAKGRTRTNPLGE